MKNILQLISLNKKYYESSDHHLFTFLYLSVLSSAQEKVQKALPGKPLTAVKVEKAPKIDGNFR